jgi:hypothetical protein
MSGLLPLPEGRGGERWAIYCRISGKQGKRTGDSDDDTVSLDTQEERARALIAAIDPTGTIDETLVLREVWTGVELHSRPKLKKALLPAIQRRQVTAVACFHPWRWTRDENHAGYLYTELDHARVVLRFAEDDPGDDAKGRLLAYVQYWGGHQDHRIRTEQTHRARAKLVQLGHAWVGCKAPYGLRWRYETVTLRDGRIKQTPIGWEADPETWPILADLFNRVLAGGGRQSLRGLAVELTERGIVSPKGKQGWSHVVIKYLLQQTVYMGEAYGLRYQTDKADDYIGQRGKSEGRRKYRNKLRPGEDWEKLPDGYAPTLIEPEAFAAVQQILAQLARGGKRPDPAGPGADVVMAGGRARCGACRRAMTLHSKTSPALVCSGRAAWDRCEARPYIRAEELDRAAIGLARLMCERPEVIAEQAALHRDHDPVGDELAGVERTIRQIEEDQRGVALVAGQVTSPAAAAPLVARLEQLDARLQGARRDHAELLARRASWAASQRFFDSFGRLAATVSAHLDDASPERLRVVIDALKIRAVVWAAGDAAHPQRYELTVDFEGVLTSGLLARLAGAECVMEASAGSSFHETPPVLTWTGPALRRLFARHGLAALPTPPRPRAHRRRGAATAATPRPPTRAPAGPPAAARVPA